MTSHPTRLIHTTIAAPFDAAYDFAHRPENFPKWASGLSESLHHSADGWIAQTPAGEAHVRFSARNDFGVLDHWVTFAGKPDISIPLRLIANGDGVEVELMLFRLPEMSDADFERDAATVRKDLEALKTLLERSA